MPTIGMEQRGGARALDMALYNGHEEVVFQLIRAGYTWGVEAHEMAGVWREVTKCVVNKKEEREEDQSLVGTRGPVVGQIRA